MKRGILVMAVIPGDYGKVRPMLIVQPEDMDLFDSIIACPLTSAIESAGPLRVFIGPNDTNQLDRPSLVMIDKLGAMEKTRIRKELGSVTPTQMTEVDSRLVLLLGLAP